MPFRAVRPAAFLLLLLAAATASAEPADPVRYPYVAAFSRAADGHRVYFCTGALVAPRWILTAAHCFHSRAGRPIGPENLWAAVGRDSLRRTEEEAQVRVERIVIHPSYETSGQAHDLALVRLADIVGPLVAQAPATESARPAEATILGFASLFEGQLAGRALNARGGPAAQVSDRLRRARMEMIDPARCVESVGPEWGGSYRICATANREAACTGDSGAPLVAEADRGPDRVVGIMTFGSGCATPMPFAIFTRVDAYGDWIAATVAAEARE